MKKVLIEIAKKFKWQILIQIIFLGIYIYLLTCPPKIIGNIVDMLYNIEENKQNILNNTYYLLGICIIVLFVRIIWKYYKTYISRGFENLLKQKLFKRFLKLKLKDIQNIKNGEIMSYFVKDVNQIRAFTLKLLSHATRTIFTFIIAANQMIVNVNFRLTVAVMIPIILGCIVIIKIKKYVSDSYRKSQDMFTEMSEYIQESTDIVI